MSTVVAEVSMSCFPAAYLDKADRVFLHPGNRYSWEKIVSGASVRSASGASRRMFAVGTNTFRGFHRVNKHCPGATVAFKRYFVEKQASLIAELRAVRTCDKLHQLCNRICAALRQELSNVSPAQLLSYNKIRKPVDLYIEHLVAMAEELDDSREALTALLFLPLDRQILAHRGLFTDSELTSRGLSRKSTYKDIATKRTYMALQKLLCQKAKAVAAERCRAFHRIYFDLLWNDRYRNWGGNLFETNP